MKIILIGAGAIGGTVAVLLKNAGYDINILCHSEKTKNDIAENGFYLHGAKGELKNKLKHKGKKIHNMDCSDCFLCENCQLGRSKMGYLLTNSLFRKQGLIDINSMLSYI